MVFLAGGVGGPVWTPITLCMYMTTFRPQSNSEKWNITFIDYGAKLILTHSSSRMPGSWALFWFLTASHIFPSGVVFTYMKMPLSPLLSYVHFILLCHPPLTVPDLCVALLIWVLTNSQLLSSHQPTNILSTPWNGFFWSWVTLWYHACSVYCLGCLFLSVFSWFDQTWMICSNQLKIDTLWQ